MTDRPTKTVQTEGGHTVVIKTYLTARETMPAVDTPDLPNSKKTQLIAEQAIVSLDGSSENIGDRLLDLPLAEYTDIIKEVTQTINPTKP
jgi:hypothetical protein